MIQSIHKILDLISRKLFPPTKETRSNYLTLYFFQDAEIRINMAVFIDGNGRLKFEGNDTGKRVLELTGDSDYEYHYIVESGEVKKMVELFNIDPTDNSAILQEIKNRFHENDAYSKFGNFMRENGINFEQFIW